MLMNVKFYILYIALRDIL